MKNSALAILLSLFTLPSWSQDIGGDTSDLPYFQIPDYPSGYSAATVAARMIDGLGFRYYWATEGLRSEDLDFRPSEEARTSEETIDHILGLSRVIINAVENRTNEPSDDQQLTFEEKRRLTLENFRRASERLKTDTANLNQMSIIFQSGEDKIEFPFWNLLNGPVADALWHVGQVVSFRRSSGNPFNSNVSVLQGILRE